MCLKTLLVETSHRPELEGAEHTLFDKRGAGIAQWSKSQSWVRVRAGAAGEFSSPWSTVCADSLFCYLFHPVLPSFGLVTVCCCCCVTAVWLGDCCRCCVNVVWLCGCLLLLLCYRCLALWLLLCYRCLALWLFVAVVVLPLFGFVAVCCCCCVNVVWLCGCLLLLLCERCLAW